ncbi:hypothetical protein PILCRDRAFT_123975 [Piloderma croceum F 1598]|uniref:Uncharacterized protein n=1 Tax=Piloderma croceum (strain F 1598) TaxID=765440 RepID=A0A0C3GI05_PILCF|nr:hypothetical protein PILCRDRAFT_123975 [Piloderma croceum F 1598]
MDSREEFDLAIYHPHDKNAGSLPRARGSAYITLALSLSRYDTSFRTWPLALSETIYSVTNGRHQLRGRTSKPMPYILYREQMITWTDANICDRNKNDLNPQFHGFILYSLRGAPHKCKLPVPL